MKKVLATVLSAMMLVTALTACAKPSSSAPASTSTPASGSTSAPAADGPDISEPVELKWHLNGNVVTDDKAVLEKANAILKEKLNVTLKPIWGTWGDFDDNAVRSINGSDDVDIYFTCSWTKNDYIGYARKGAYLRLDDPANNLIEKYASDLWSKLPKVLQQGATIDGAEGKGVYAIPGYKDCATQLTWDVNLKVLKELGYTEEDIKTIDFYSDKFAEMMKKAKDVKGKDFYPLIVEGAVLERMMTNTILVTGDNTNISLLSYYIDPTDPSKDIGSKLVNKYSTPEFEKFVKKMHEYYKAGYVDPAMSNPQQANDKRTESQKAGAYLFGTQSYSLGYETQAAAERGFEVAMVPTTPAYVDTTVSQGALMAVSVTSKNPERAVMFLNEVNTNPELFQLIAYGIEGTHYTKVGDGTIEFNEDARKAYTPWLNGLGSVAIEGNGIPLKDQGPDFYDTFRAYYGAAKAVPVLGYAFDQTPVLNESAALATAAAQYMLPLTTGSVDPAVELPKFLAELEKNGIEKYVTEANAQLDAYLKG